MAKETGINYFFEVAGVDSGDFGILYTFEEGAGTEINSIPYGKPDYTGILSSESTFWQKPGSGLFSGNSINISNASGLSSFGFTHLISYERIGTGASLLFSSLNGESGINLGLTSTNKLYFQGYNQQPIFAVNSNNIGSKNLISLAYTTNYITLGYYNFTSQKFETESFIYPVGVVRSDIWRLGRSFTGYMDYYMYFPAYLGNNTLETIASGLYNVPTGIGYATETICSTGITGYVQIPFVETGVTGYSVLPTGFDGVGDFTGVFPTNNVTVSLTGIVSSGYLLSGVQGLNCVTYTGDLTVLYDTNTGYVSSFGMDKVVMLDYVDTGDILKWGRSYKPFDNIYNISLQRAYSGYVIDESQNTGNLNIFLNGLALANSGYTASGIYLFISGSPATDVALFDLASGGKTMVIGLSFAFTYTGQEIYLNGLNMISGYDFTYNGSEIVLTGSNTGITGVIFDHPIKLGFVTGNSSLFSDGIKFSRDTSNIYLNGLRQKNKVDFIESSHYDMITGNGFNENNNLNIYNNNGNFWEE